MFDLAIQEAMSEEYSQDTINHVFESKKSVKEISYTRIFEKHRASKSSVIVHRGGARSSKSYSICQSLILDWVSNPDAGLRILIVRKTLPSIRTSTLVTFKSVVDTFGVGDRIKVERKDLNFWYGKNLIHFSGLDDPEKIKCYTPDHDVLTDKGFVPVSQVKKGDKLATRHPVTGVVEYLPVTKTWVYDYKGKLYKPKVNNKYSYLSFRVTPEHKILGQKRIKTADGYKLGKMEYVEAKDVKGRFYIPRSGTWSGRKIKTFSIPKLDFTEEISIGSREYSSPNDHKALKNGRKTADFPVNNFLSFIGWYISEGCLGTESRSEIHISQKKEAEKNKLREMLSNFPYKSWEYKDTHTLSGKDLYNYLKPLGKCYEKRIPRDILDLHPEHLQHLFDALMLGDGHKTNTGRFIYGTTSPGLVDDVCELSLKLGLVPTVKKVRTDYPSNYKNGRDFWQISISKQERTCVNGLDTEDYDGKVYCFEVPPYHNVMIRHNGRTQWCGQSSEWHIIWMEEATEFDYEDYQQLQLRLSAPSIEGLHNHMIVSFNPIDANHWIKTILIANETNLTEIVSNYKDNPFLSQSYIQILEDLISKDANFARVYADGEWGLLENLIYSKNWDVVDYFPEGLDVFHGLDFGFNAPMGLVKIGKASSNKEFWLQELFYESERTLDHLIGKLPYLLGSGVRKPIYCDSANPEKIKSIKEAGFTAKEAIKGKNSIIEGIDYIKTCTLHIVRGSNNLLDEIKTYSFKKKNGIVIDEPIDYKNHLMDAMRYGIISHVRKGGAKIRWLDIS